MLPNLARELGDIFLRGYGSHRRRSERESLLLLAVPQAAPGAGRKKLSLGKPAMAPGKRQLKAEWEGPARW